MKNQVSQYKVIKVSEEGAKYAHFREEKRLNNYTIKWQLEIGVERQ